eukprot:360138-Prorocentrum_lima.AAC.1
MEKEARLERHHHQGDLRARFALNKCQADCVNFLVHHVLELYLRRWCRMLYKILVSDHQNTNSH